jgi:hypothetical protein
MDGPGIDPKNWPAPADFAAQAFSPEARRTLQVRIGNCCVIFAVRFAATSICEITVSGVPLRVILREWLAFVPGQLARECVRLLLFQSGKACGLLRLSFGIVAEKQSLKT